jgi:hypothetical protein
MKKKPFWIYICYYSGLIPIVWLATEINALYYPFHDLKWMDMSFGEQAVSIFWLFGIFSAIYGLIHLWYKLIDKLFGKDEKK